MSINIKLEGVENVVEALKEIPTGAKFVLQAAVKRALSKGRTEIDRAVRDRYNIAQKAVLQAIGKPKVYGLSGSITAKGSKFPLSMFPMKDIRPGGIVVQELKSGPPINLLHAFSQAATATPRPQYAKSDKIAYLRGLAHGSPKYPIRWIMGLSVPQMIAEHKEVEPRIERAIQLQLDGEIDRLVPLVMDGKVGPAKRAAESQ